MIIPQAILGAVIAAVALAAFVIFYNEVKPGRAPHRRAATDARRGLSEEIANGPLPAR